MTKLMQFVALIAVLGCVLPATVTAQTWGPVVLCGPSQKPVGFRLYFDPSTNKTIVAIVFYCTRGGRIVSPPGPPPPGTGIPGAVHTCRSGTTLRSCRLQLVRPGKNTRANNLNCRCNDGQTLLGDGSKVGVWHGWSPSCILNLGMQTKAGKPPHPFYIYDARFPCYRQGAEEEEEEGEEVEEEEE